ncbi:hypothetical protein F383_20798 [Gossypium arboreum]|uniref:Uncharacterized protein n=1 Tax=Gossypium arboreum TaxID=29729 RepID=A0A0B0NYZ7_GOSAR|nr:hypothetical protein F383_20798 [Gossypium arboreum]
MMAWKIVYFCPHEKRHGRVSQPCLTHGQKSSQYALHGPAHGRVTWPCGISQYTVQVWHGLAHGQAHECVWPFRRAHGLVTQVCVLAV